MSPTATETASAAASDGSTASPAPGKDRVVTTLRFRCSAEQAWRNMMFYEQIERRPPLHLRTLLPIPIRTEGRKSEVGEVATCLYEGGHLLKRVVETRENEYYGFEVIEQTLRFGGGMRLSRGSYTFKPRADGMTDVALETNYTSPRKPRALMRPVETRVAHMFHRFILREMRKKAEGSA